MVTERFQPSDANDPRPGPQEHDFTDPNADLEEGQCICGEFNCKDEYSHWTSGF